MASQHSRFSLRQRVRRLKLRRKKTVRELCVTREKNCHLCGATIRKGMEVTVNKQTFHPGCAGKIAKEKKIAST